MPSAFGFHAPTVLPSAAGEPAGDLLTVVAGLPSWETPAAAWSLAVNLPLTTLTSWSSEAGTWTTDGTKIVSPVGTSPARCRLDLDVPHVGSVFEVEVQIPAAGGNLYAGLLTAWSGSGSGGNLTRLEYTGSVYKLETEVQTTTALAVQPYAWTPGNWFKVQQVYGGHVIDHYVNGVFQFSTSASTPYVTPTGIRIGLYTYGTIGWFRNLKVWKRVLPI